MSRMRKASEKNCARSRLASDEEKSGCESKDLSLKAHAVGLERENQARKPIPEADRQEAERKVGVGSRKTSGKTHGVGVGREKQAEKPTPEADRYVAERKLGVVSRKQAGKPTAWA